MGVGGVWTLMRRHHSLHQEKKLTVDCSEDPRKWLFQRTGHMCYYNLYTISNTQFNFQYIHTYILFKYCIVKGEKVTPVPPDILF